MVVGLTAGMMVAEIAGGTIFGSMALLADGWHMSTHAGALGIAAFAYRYARRHARDPRFAFGTGKLGDLAGFASAIVLAMVLLGIGYESVMRLFQPVVDPLRRSGGNRRRGLAVNLASAALLGHDDHHDHGHDHGHDDHGHHHHHDHNLRAAYWHVLADALTSVLAIAALLAAWAYGWTWLDPVIGVVGALVIAHWSWRLIRDVGRRAARCRARSRRSSGRSANGSRSATTASPTCMSGAWGRAIRARSSRWCPTRPSRSSTTRRGSSDLAAAQPRHHRGPSLPWAQH